MEVVSSSCEVRGGRERRLKLTTGPAYPAPHQNPGRNPFPCPGEHRISWPPSTSGQLSSSNTSTPTPRLLTTFLLLPTLRLGVGPRPAGFLPLICPPTVFESDARQTGLAGHF
ncbi:hypothetical protein Ddc_18904 [Ditylenchus destructor]|nr:hypothetical protein Ddc_18904 [Ditylenchus destructor]